MTVPWYKGSLKSTCDDLATRARKSYFALKSKLELAHKLWLKLYESIIVPIITYSSETSIKFQ
jgi:hypothetical protein